MSKTVVQAFVVACLVILPSVAGATGPLVGSDADACTLQAGGAPSPAPCRLRHDARITAGPCTGDFCTYTVESDAVAAADLPGVLALRTVVDDGSNSDLGACMGPEPVTDALDPVSPFPCGQDCSDAAFGVTLTCRSTRTHAVHIEAGECVLILVHATLVYDEVVAVAGTYLPFQFCR